MTSLSIHSFEISCRRQTFSRLAFLNQICNQPSAAEAAVESAAFQDVGVISRCAASKVVHRNKIRRERTKARTTLSSEIIVKEYNNGEFGLYIDGRKDRTISIENNRKNHDRRTHKLDKRTSFEVHCPRKFQNNTNHCKTNHNFYYIFVIEWQWCRFYKVSCDRLQRNFNTDLNANVIRNVELNAEASTTVFFVSVTRLWASTMSCFRARGWNYDRA